MNASHKGPVTRKMFPFDDVIMVDNNSGDGMVYMVAIISEQDDNNKGNDNPTC